MFALVACGPSSAQIKTARTARYHTTASAAFQAGVAALKDNDYKIQQVDPVAGRAITDVKWYEVDGTSMSRDSEGRPQMTSAGGIMFAVEIAVMPDADTFYVQVIPHVQQMKAGYSAPFDIKEGDGAMPGWVTGKLDNLYMSIYGALKKDVAVPGAAGPGATPPIEPAPAAADPEAAPAPTAP
ncbi:MAG: hypothetical protein IPH44_42035 [Myxococcales bacterium]|nr:hypothetical protein [Myxococcales bacterium]MBP6843084.1 hypothetical protein [Kofleriaceae bacterium]